MPHVMVTLIPGGTAFVPTEQKLDDLKRARQRALRLGRVDHGGPRHARPSRRALSRRLSSSARAAAATSPGACSSVQSMEYDRPLPAHRPCSTSSLNDHRRGRAARSPSTWAVPGTRAPRRYSSPVLRHASLSSPVYDVDDSLHLGRSARPTTASPTRPAGSPASWPPTSANVPFVVDAGQRACSKALGVARPDRWPLPSRTLGRTAVRRIESLYIAGLMKEWVRRADRGRQGRRLRVLPHPRHHHGCGHGLWEAPRGALYHSEEVNDGKIDRLPDHHSHHLERWLRINAERRARTHGAGP